MGAVRSRFGQSSYVRGDSKYLRDARSHRVPTGHLSPPEEPKPQVLIYRGEPRLTKKPVAALPSSSSLTATHELPRKPAADPVDNDGALADLIAAVERLRNRRHRR